MADIELLKRLAEACDIERCADEEERDRNLNEFYSAVEPEDVAALIAENEALTLQAMNHEQAARYWKKRFDEDTTEAIDLLKAELERVRAQNESLADHMRVLACRLGAGGYNAPEVDPDVFASKIHGGIDMLVDPLVADLERVRADAERLRNISERACLLLEKGSFKSPDALSAMRVIEDFDALGKGGRADG